MSAFEGPLGPIDELADVLACLANTSNGPGPGVHDRIRNLLSAAIREEIRDELGIDEASGP